MFLSYSASVIVVSLALYGLWQVIKDVWKWFISLNYFALPAASFVIIVYNLEYEVEELLRYLDNQLTEADREDDVIVIDCGSDDLTSAILHRLADELSTFTVVSSSRSAPILTEVLPMCRGAVVHVLDLNGRLNAREFMAVVSSLLHQNRQHVTIREN